MFNLIGNTGKLSVFTSCLNWLLLLSHVSLMYMLKINIKSTIVSEISKEMHDQCREEDLCDKEHRVQSYYCRGCGSYVEVTYMIRVNLST